MQDVVVYEVAVSINFIDINNNVEFNTIQRILWLEPEPGLGQKTENRSTGLFTHYVRTVNESANNG